jgi:acyl carrier protein
VTEPVMAEATNGPDTRTRLIQCFREVFPALDETQILGAEYTELQAWDSLASLTLVAIIEDEFACTLPDDLVASLTSFDRIHTAVADLTGRD